MYYLGEIAALGTAMSWSTFAILFTKASQRIGSFSMSNFRMLFIVFFLAIASIFFSDKTSITNISSINLILLTLSGLTGFFLCDLLLFQSFVDIGPGAGVLIFNFYPFVSALLALMFLGERLSTLAWLGMGVTLIGIFSVISEKKKINLDIHKTHFRRGILLVSGAVILQAISFTLAKPAMIGEDSAQPLTATLIRAIVAAISYWSISLIKGDAKKIITKVRETTAIKMTFFGSFFAALGVWLSMIAIKLAPVGIAATLMALMPIFVLPMSSIVYKEKITIRAIIGAIISCIGVAILFHS